MPLVHTRSGCRVFQFDRCPASFQAVTSSRDVDTGPEAGAPWLDDLGLDPARIAWASQVHGSRILALTHPGAQGEADALVTNRPDLALSVRTADCAPVFIVDPVRSVFALVHAGWRGTAAGIAGATIRTLHALYGSNPSELWVGIGPAIGAGAYQVGDEVRRAFDARHVTEDGDRWRLDLPGAVGADVEAAGVPPANVEPSGACTVRENDAYYSFRLEQTSSRLTSLLFGRSVSSRS